MGFISASFKTTTLILTPTLQSQMLSVEKETTIAWRLRAYEIVLPKKCDLHGLAPISFIASKHDPP